MFSAGTGLYASASLGRGSYEAVTFAIAEKNNRQVKAVRIILDIVMVVTGVLLGGKFGTCTIDDYCFGSGYTACERKSKTNI